MVQITLHIERLLVHNDCVIVPGLGGFVVQDCSAKYVEEEDLFLPPYRSVSFNQRLTMNDGLLIQDVAQYHNLEYKDAVRIVNDKVAKIRDILEHEGHYTFHGIGTLRSTDYGTFEFEPIACGVSAPDLYGLDCYYVTSRQKAVSLPKKVSINRHDDDTLTFRLHMNVIRYAAVAAVAAVFFFVCIAPLNSAIKHQRSEAGMLHHLYSLIVNSCSDNTLQHTDVIDPASKVKQSAPISKKNKQVQTVTEENFDDTNCVTADTNEGNNLKPATHEDVQVTTNALTLSTKTEVKDKELPYAIVVASCVTIPNANAMIDNWKAKGLPSASIYDKGKYIRVFYGAYTSCDEAHVTLKKLRDEHPEEFAEAWVYEIP